MEKNTQNLVGFSATKTLNSMKAACKEQTGAANVWHQKGSDFVMEISNRVHDDGAITGRILRLGRPAADGHRPNRLVGTIRIEGNGTVTRAHRFLAEAAERLKSVRVAREIEEERKAVLSKRPVKTKKKVRNEKWMEAARARAAYARSIRMERLKKASAETPVAKEQDQDMLAARRERMAYARKVRLDRIAEKKTVQAKKG